MERSHSIHSQPDDLTCGPTCLHSVYQFFGEEQPLGDLINEVEMLEEGGTLASHLGNHALNRRYQATIYTMNINMFDPTWFKGEGSVNLADKLKKQVERKSQYEKLKIATRSYLRFLFLGGQVQFISLNRTLLLKLLANGQPLIAGLSATYLYQCAREDPISCADDDVGGEPSGHFVVLKGYQPESKTVMILDPYESNPLSKSRRYEIHIDHLIGAIMLGALTYDANLLEIKKGKP